MAEPYVRVTISASGGSRTVVSETVEMDWPPEGQYPPLAEDAVTDAALKAFRRVRRAVEWADVMEEPDGG